MALKILIAPDKFKGTLTAAAAAQAIATGWLKARPSDQLDRLPISDGGDGFGQAMSLMLGAKVQQLKTIDAAHRPCSSQWWWEPRTKTAIIESANIIGLAQLPHQTFHPFQLDTFGVGAALAAAAKRGAKRCFIGIGGSATNDGGFGLALALGWKFFDKDGRQITAWPKMIALAKVEPPKQKLRIKELIVAVDVQNKLLGKHGCTRIYGPQKGLAPADFPLAEKALGQLAKVLAKFSRQTFANQPGSGAAGGLGFGLCAFAGAKMRPGFDLFAKKAKLVARLAKVDLVITGEGSIDHSTLMGKGVGELAALCHQQKIPCLGMGGVVMRTVSKKQKYFSALYGLTDLTTTENAKSQPAFWLEKLAEKAASEFSLSLK